MATKTGTVTKTLSADVGQSHKIVSESQVNYITAQIFTAHSRFGEYRFRFKLKDNPRCGCDDSSSQGILWIIAENLVK